MTNTISTATTTSNIASRLSFTPNDEQAIALTQLLQFVQPADPRRFCILRGAAGTGKTSIVKAITDYLHHEKIAYRIAAPTGRAAQVIGRKTGNGARTIHATIFTPEAQEDGSVRFLSKPNPGNEYCVFIIDEASMIPDRTGSGNDGFIQDTGTLTALVNYVKQGNAKNKVIFIGDTNQLPPIENPDFSPALHKAYLEEKFGGTTMEMKLQTIMRHKTGSYVLDNAESIRNAIEKNIPAQTLRCKNIQSFSRAIQTYLQVLREEDDASATMIAYTNKQVNAMNSWARKMRFEYKDREAIKAGDLLVLNQNTIKQDELFMRGMQFRVLETRPSKPFADLQFVNACLGYKDAAGHEKTIVSKILIDTLLNEKGMLPLAAVQKLVHEAIKYNRKFRDSRRPEDDPFVGALRMRYGYALTCHKAQGGEWQHVFLNPLYNNEDLRWCYTAVTRASEHLYSWPRNIN